MTWDRSRVIPTIIQLISEGSSLVTICNSDDMPSRETVYTWLDEDAAFSDSYARARERCADYYAERIVDIASERPPLVTDTNHRDGDARMDSAFVAWQRVQIDTLKWVASKLKPGAYADKITQVHTGADGGAIAHKVEIEYVSSPSAAPGGVPLPPRAYR